jgi:type II secretion system protein G
MKRRGFTLVELMVVTGIIGLLAALVMPAILKTRMVGNEGAAKATLRTISNAIEMYVTTNGTYPSAETDLLAPSADPPYMRQSYDGQTMKGYIYQYNFNNGYTVTATPEVCNKTGSKVFTVISNEISEADCS